uniref:Metallothionein-like protein n=2 Tax=Oryza meridionalis TaxID=40149 RepID=A0A0E0EPR0_9ORYZ
MPAAARSLSLCPLPLPRCHLAPPSRLPLAPPPRPPPPPRSVVAADPSRCHLRFQPSPSPATSASPPRAASTSSAAAIAPPSLGASASPLALLPSPSAAVSASATAVAVAERRRCRLRLASLLLLLPSTAVGPSSTAAAITERRRCVLRCLRQRPLLCPPPLPEPTSRKAPNLEGGTNPVELLAACWSSPQGRRTCDESEGRFQMEDVPSLYPQIRHPHTSTHPRKKYPDLEEESNSTKVTIVLDLALEKKARQFEVATNFGKTAHGCCCGSNCNCNPCNGCG